MDCRSQGSRAFLCRAARGSGLVLEPELREFPAAPGPARGEPSGAERSLDFGPWACCRRLCHPGSAPGAKVLRDWGGEVPSQPGEGVAAPSGGSSLPHVPRSIEHVHHVEFTRGGFYPLAHARCCSGMRIPLRRPSGVSPGGSRLRSIPCAPQAPWLSWGSTSCSATALPCSATSSASSTPPTSRKYLSHTWRALPALR